MAKKRKCRYTAEELAIHEEAVRLRKMTDKQLVTEFHRAGEQETPPNAPDVLPISSDSNEAEENTNGVKKLLEALAEGRCKGIKSGYTYKIAQLAEEMGLI